VCVCVRVYTVFNNNHLHAGTIIIYSPAAAGTYNRDRWGWGFPWAAGGCQRGEEWGGQFSWEGEGCLLQYSTDGKQAKTPTSCAVRINHARRWRRRPPIQQSENHPVTPNTVIHTFIYTHTHTHECRIGVSGLPPLVSRRNTTLVAVTPFAPFPEKLIYQREHPRAPKS